MGGRSQDSQHNAEQHIHDKNFNSKQPHLRRKVCGKALHFAHGGDQVLQDWADLLHIQQACRRRCECQDSGATSHKNAELSHDMQRTWSTATRLIRNESMAVIKCCTVSATDAESGSLVLRSKAWHMGQM